MGQLYSSERYDFRGKVAKTRLECDCLREYGEVFKTVCVDVAYYTFPNQQDLERMAEQVPEDFRFGLKVTDTITVKKIPNLDRFGDLAAIHPTGAGPASPCAFFNLPRLPTRRAIVSPLPMHPNQKEKIRADLTRALSLLRPFEGPSPPVGSTKRAYSGPGYRFYLDEEAEEVMARTLRTLLVDCGWSIKFSESHIANRATAASGAKPPPSLLASVTLGSIGFMFVSVAGFAPWAFAGRDLHHAVGEVGLYLACAVVFIGLSGAVLHRLIIGPGSLWRFYALFAFAFTAYSVGWIIGWMALRGNVGSLTGLLLGTSVMGWLLVHAFDSRNELLKVVAALFILNALGYFAGGWVEGYVASMPGDRLLGFAVTRHERMRVAMLLMQRDKTHEP